jgi:uncharacterized protein (TIGR03435 family)
MEFSRLVTIGGMALAAFGFARGQQAFEVASIRPNHSGSDEANVNSLPGGRLVVTNESLRELIKLAFGVKDYQIAKAPGWIDAARFDIAAKTAGATGSSFEELKSRVRDLLESRFALASHRETRELPVYSLTVGKNGSKLKEHNDGSFTKTRKGCGHLAGSRVTMDVLATMLSRQFERDVINRTGLTGKFDFELDWTPDTERCPATENPGIARPSIVTAVQEQLGLKLEAAKGPVEILVIDHVEKSSEN